MTDALDRVLQDARRDWAVEAKGVRWDAIEGRLFTRIASAQHAERRSLAPGRGRSWTTAAAGLVSAAAVAAIVVGGAHDTTRVEPGPVRPVDDVTSIARIDGVGPVLVNGRPVTAGTALHLDDVIEARGAQTTVSRPGKVTLVVERGSSAVVTHLQGVLVLALTRGAIEAQVTPVATSEAFAVDVGPSRVAVHGTRFRVARAGERVVLDLNEGVIAVGETPRIGSTMGGLVIAPAHAEFMAADPRTTLRVTHEASAIRAPALLESAGQPKPETPSSFPPAFPPVPTTAGARADRGEVAAPAVTATPRAEPRPGPNVSGWATGAAPDPNAQASIAAAVRSCFAERVHADNVTVLVSTTLFLQLHEDGSVSSARFEPPVAPDVNACSAESIYRARFTHGGTVTIPVSVKN